MEYVGNDAAAAYVGTTPSAWRSYVTRKDRRMAPKPIRREVRGGHALPVWTAEQLDEWMTSRPGRGAPGRPRAKRSAA
jgi:hypothetical protein